MAFIKKHSMDMIPTSAPAVDVEMRGDKWAPEKESVVSGETKFEGNIFTSQPIQIYGKVKGDIQSASEVECSGGGIVGNIKGVTIRIVDAASVTGDIAAEKSVVIDENTTLVGNVSAVDVTVNGRVTGNLDATGKVVLGSSGMVTGDIRASELQVDGGGRVNGRVEMSSSGGRGMEYSPAGIQEEEYGQPDA